MCRPCSYRNIPKHSRIVSISAGATIASGHTERYRPRLNVTEAAVGSSWHQNNTSGGSVRFFATLPSEAPTSHLCHAARRRSTWPHRTKQDLNHDPHLHNSVSRGHCTKTVAWPCITAGLAVPQLGSLDAQQLQLGSWTA